MNKRQITVALLHDYAAYLHAQERSASTIEKYLRDVRAFAAWLGGRITGFRFRDKTTGWGLNITETGAEWFDRCRDEFFCVPSTLEKAARHNGQLRRPSIPGEGRAQILALYQAEGYDAVEDAFARKNRAAQWKGWIRYHLRSSIPAPIRRWMKKIIRGIRRRRLPGRS